MNKLTNQGRIRLLTSASAAVAAVVLSQPALAGSATVTLSSPVTAAQVLDAAQETIGSPQKNTGIVSANAANNVGGLPEVATLNDSISQTNDDHSANAFGNATVNTINGLAAIDNNPPNDGAAAQALQINTNTIGATLDNNTVGAYVTDFQTGTVAVTKNDLSASANGNQASTLITGQIPSGYASGTDGHSALYIELPLDGPWNLVDADGSLLASTAQINEGASVSASAGGVANNVISLNLFSAATLDIAGSPTLDLNTITSSANGNSSDSTINIEAAGPAPTFNGTAVVSNLQSNAEQSDLAAHSITSKNDNSMIVATTNLDGGLPFYSGTASTTYVLTGSLSVEDNSITSSASGNESLGDGVGNEIVLNGTSFDGLATGPALTEIDYDPILDQEVTADLIINSAQGNSGVSPVTRFGISAETSGGLPVVSTNSIGANLRALDGATVTVANNKNTATASGNAESSAFDTQGTVNSFDGTLALASQQANIYVDVAASNTNAYIGAETSRDQTSLPNSTITNDLNRIAASAYGSRSDQGITLDAGTTTLPGTTVTLQAGLDTPNVYAEGGATASNLQYAEDSTVKATQSAGFVGTHDLAIASVVDSTLETTRAAIEALARGNSASTDIALSGNDIGGSLGAVNSQAITGFSSVEASGGNSNAGVAVDARSLVSSKLNVLGNREAATAYGNSVTQNVSLDGNTIDLLATTGVDLRGGTDPTTTVAGDELVLATANVAVASLQVIDGDDATVTAALNNDRIGASANGLSGSTVTVGSTEDGVRNTQDAVAVGNSGTNGLSLDGNNVGTGAGVASVQIADGVVISATNTSPLVEASTGDLQNSTVEVSDALQRAIAYGNTVSNSLDVGMGDTTVDASLSGVASTVTYVPGQATGFVLDGDAATQPHVTAAYGVLNDQTTHAEVTAEALGNSSLLADVGSVTNSKVNNTGHDFVAAGYGNEGTNSASLDGNNLASSNLDYAAVVNLTSAQTLVSNDVYDSSVLARASVLDGSTDGVIVDTEITGNVTDSTVNTSGSTIQALGYGNLVANTVSGSFNNVNTESDGSFTQGIGSVTGTGGPAAVATTDASFSLNNVQAAAGAVTATLLNGDALPNTDSASVLTHVTGNVIDSSIHTDGNALSAAATANASNNKIVLEGNNLATSSSLVNYQIDPTSVTAEIGVKGGVQNVVVVPGTSDTPFPFNYSVVLNGNCGGGTCTGVTGEDRIPAAGLTSGQIAALVTAGWTLSGSNYVRATTQAITPTMTSVAFFALDGSVLGDSVTVLGTPDQYGDVFVPGSGGVIARIDGNVDPSTVTVNKNSASGSVTGNSATNLVSVTASTVTDGNDHIFTSATTTGGDTVASGDHMLTNVQVVTQGGALDSTVNSTFAIDMLDGGTIDDSTLEVDGNNQSSVAVANTASNSIKLDVGNSLDVNANDTGAGTALASNQSSAATVSATSNMAVFAPAASDSSTVSMSGNTNLALGVINDVTNTVTVDATNAGFVTFDTNAVLDVDSGGGLGDTVALGDHVLLNKQTASTSVSATASTDIFNDDNTAGTTEGINNGTVAIIGNQTVAEASANRADNKMTVDVSANLTASAGLVNNQTNSASATASATTDASLRLYGDATGTTPALNGSTATLGQNSTSALARGNSASNVLNYSAGATYADGFGVAGITTDPATPNATVSAKAAVLNVQNNSGAITASSTDASYLVALNTTTSATSVTNATVGVIGNSIDATAYGNYAQNSITVASLNGAMPTAALGNVQNNSGPVIASVTSVTYGITTGVGAATGSTLGVNSNSINATAVGNSSVNTITAR